MVTIGFSLRSDAGASSAAAEVGGGGGGGLAGWHGGEGTQWERSGAWCFGNASPLA